MDLLKNIQWRSVLLDFATKMAFWFFSLSIILLFFYQAWFLYASRAAPFLEPDNYEYLLFAKLSVAAGSLNVSNPYLVYSRTGFFEHAGLYVVPVALHVLVPEIPLVWDFRIIYALAVACIYLITLLIAKKILDHYPINLSYKYTAYALILSSYLLMQYTQVIDWRGNTFIVALQLLIFYVVCDMAFDWRDHGVVYGQSIAILVLLVAASYFMWTGWAINLIPIMLFGIFVAYDRLKGPNLWKAMAIIPFGLAVLLCLFYVPIQHAIVQVLSSRYNILGDNLNCFNNPLSLAEVSCLNFQNGLYTVALDLFFLCITFKYFVSNQLFGLNRQKYDYFIVGLYFMILLQLPLVLVYVRLLQVIAPYLTLAFALGAVTLFAKGGSTRVIVALTIFIVLVSSEIAFLQYWQTVAILYSLDNPPGLYAAASWLSSNAQNSTVLAFYGFGDALELYGHVKTYADTVQGLNNTRIVGMDAYYNGSTPCQLPALPSRPEYVMTSNTLLEFTIFQNASASSLVRDPTALEACNYSLVFEDQGFYLFRPG